MHRIYITVLAACLAAVVWLVAWRLVQWRSSRRRMTRGRILNEWIWTLVPLGVLVALLWSALAHR